MRVVQIEEKMGTLYLWTEDALRIRKWFSDDGGRTWVGLGTMNMPSTEPEGVSGPTEAKP